MLTAAGAIKAQKWNSIHTLEYYSTTNRGKVLTLATSWRDLADLVLSERSRHTRPHNK
jgi:hypothetical protein